MSAKPPVLLHLGCGLGRLEGWVNCDKYPTEFADAVFDLEERWPFEDGQVREIYASHVLEHVGHEHFFREAWRVLEPNGGICVRVPYGGHRLAWSDPTHVKAWWAESFCYLQPDYGRVVGNPQEFGWPAPFGVAKISLRLAAKWARLMRNRWTRRLLLPWFENIENSVEELWAWLYAIKDQASRDEFTSTRSSNAVPVLYTMYTHHYEGRATLREGEMPALTTLRGSETVGRYGFDAIPN